MAGLASEENETGHSEDGWPEAAAALGDVAPFLAKHSGQLRRKSDWHVPASMDRDQSWCAKRLP
eukprot:3425829-Rhodomonas_salina.2